MASNKQEQIRKAAESDLLTFIRLVAPHRILGACHEDLIHWWTRQEAKSHQLTLYPRDHQKSAMVAYRCAWEITRQPDTTILYISATSTLAQKQLKFIQDILTSPIYRRYWPEMINEQEAKRNKWTANEFNVDHPLRASEGVRDSTVFAAGLTTNITGLHCRVAVLDDVVVKENAYTEEGRRNVAFQYSLLASIETTGSQEWVVGTRYHPADLYNDLMAMEELLYDDQFNVVGSEPVYEVMEQGLEDSPDRDGTGQYLWPKQRRHDGRFFGFDIKERAKKYAKYLDKSQFYAQYYNDPSDPTNLRIDPNRFQYYDQVNVHVHDGFWYFRDKRLNLVAALDLAFTEGKSSDFTAIVVCGIDEDGRIYVLDIDRFKTDKISIMTDHIVRMHNKWYFRKLRAETVSGQGMIVQEIKNKLRELGVSFAIDEHNPSRHDGSKAERIAAVLVPRYDNMVIWHYRGGNCQVLEDELRYEHPEHDDVSDALAACIEALRAPTRATRMHRANPLQYNSRFGGVAH
jgi:phage terminase large subunit-like protein